MIRRLKIYIIRCDKNINEVYNMKKLSISIFLFCIVISIWGCRLEDAECSVNLNIPIRTASLPDSGQINQPLVIPIRTEIGNGCGRYAGVQTERIQNEVFIYARGQFDGCICTMQITQVDTSFSFLPSATGNLIFNFSDGYGNNIRDSIYIRP
jgi:hypothetical protein